MSGVITLTSAPGQGTIVEITLPRAGVLAGDGTRS
jgi:signal transduction histidine kinase